MMENNRNEEKDPPDFNVNTFSWPSLLPQDRDADIEENEDEREGDDDDADTDADDDNDEDSEDEDDPQQQTIKEGGVMIPSDLFASLPRAFQIGWEALSGPQQQTVIMASRRPRVTAAADHEEEDYDTTARTLLTKKGFDPDDLNKRNEFGLTPMNYYSAEGNVTMVRYLITRVADCRKADRDGCCPMYYAARGGHLEVMQLLFRESGAHEDIQRQNQFGTSPLRIALRYGYFDVVYWLILNGALAPDDGDADDNAIDDMFMRGDLRQGTHDTWRDDRRRTVLSWARDAVTSYDNFQLFVTGTNLFPDDDVPEILQIIADYVAGTQPQLRTLRQLMNRLPAFIDDVRFIEEEEEDDED